MVKFDPRTKIVVGNIAISAVLFSRQPVTLIAEFGIVLLAVFLFRLGPRLRRAFRLVWSMFLLVLVLGLVFYDLTTTFLLSIRLFTLLSVSFICFFSIDPQELGHALHKMGLPYGISFVVTTSMRYVPLIGRKARQISDAQQARGIDLRPRIKNISNYAALIIPLLVQSFILADELALAMESRGFGCKQRSSRRTYRLAAKDYGVMALSLILLAGLIWWDK